MPLAYSRRHVGGNAELWGPSRTEATPWHLHIHNFPDNLQKGLSSVFLVKKDLHYTAVMENQKLASSTFALFPRVPKRIRSPQLSFSQGKTGPAVSQETGMKLTGMYCDNQMKIRKISSRDRMANLVNSSHANKFINSRMCWGAGKAYILRQQANKSGLLSGEELMEEFSKGSLTFN